MAMDWMLKRAKASIVHWATAVRKEVIQVEAVQDENDMRQVSLPHVVTDVRPLSNTKAHVACYQVVMRVAGVALVKEIHVRIQDLRDVCLLGCIHFHALYHSNLSQSRTPPRPRGWPA
jgi:hypothetical protein